MKKYISLLILPSLLCLHTLWADHIINFFVYPYPDVQDVHERLKHPSNIDKHHINGLLQYVSGAGIFSTYAGFIDITNFDGQTVYPLQHHEEPFLYLVVTEEIVPIMMLANTVAYWEIPRHRPAAFFKMEKKQDEKTGLFLWDVREEPRPQDNKVPLESLVIIADPHDIYVPAGVSLADDTPHLLLPPLYVKKSMNVVKHGLYMLTISHLFRPSRILYTKEERRYVLQVR